MDFKAKKDGEKRGEKAIFLFQRRRRGGGKYSCHSSERRDATHMVFVHGEQTDCKLADNFGADNVIYSCQPFVRRVCFIQI